MNLRTRFRIIGYESVGIGAFLLLLIWLQLGESNSSSIVVNFAWVYGIIGVTLILVGLETLALTSEVVQEAGNK